MSNIILRDKHGHGSAYSDVTELRVSTTDGGTAIFSEGPRPKGKINITTTAETDVTNYATAQVVDENLTAENIAKDKTVLGITGILDYVKTLSAVPETKDTSIIYNSTNNKYYLWKAEV